MNKISVINKNKRIDFLIDDIKAIIGNDYESKDMILKVFINYFNKLSNSDFSIENSFANVLKINDEELNLSDYTFYYVSSDFDLVDDIKMNSKSLSLQYINSILENIEYSEEFQTLTIVLESLLEDIVESNDDMITPLLNVNFTKKDLIKLISLTYMKEESEINNYDLSYEEKINIQLRMILRISKSINKKIIVLINSAKLCFSSYSIIKRIPGLKIVLFETTEVDNVKDVLILDDICIDTMNEELIYDLCMNYFKNLTINEMKTKLIEDYLKPRIVFS